MDYNLFIYELGEQNQYLLQQLSKTRPQEIVIIALLAVSIGIGIAILIQLKKLKDRL